MDPQDAYRRLVEQVDALRRAWRSRRAAAGALAAGGLSLGTLVVLIAADNGVALPVAGRWIACVIAWGTFLVLGLRLIAARLIDDRRDDYFAALIEQHHPELGSRFINALQLGRGDRHGTSAELTDAILVDSGHAAADLDPADSLDPRPLRRSAGVFGCSLLVILLYAALLPARFVNGAARVLLPMADISPYTSTQFVTSSIRPGDTRIPEGASLAITAEVAGVVPAAARIERTGPDGSIRPAAMTAERDQPRRFRAVVPDANAPFDYVIVAGDARSRPYHVDVVARPRIARLSLDYRPPAYAGRPSRTVSVSDGEIAALAGTRVELTLLASKPLHSARLATDAGQPIDLRRGDDARTWRGAFLLWPADSKQEPPAGVTALRAPARYQLRLKDLDSNESADPLWRSIALVADRPPTVAITAPGRDLPIRPNAPISVAIEAADDLGLSVVRLLFRVNDGPEIHEIAQFNHSNGPPDPRTADRFAWSLPSDLKGGDVVQYWATAADRNNVTGPGVAESRRFTLTVITPEDAAARLDVQVSNYAQILEELARLQRENRAQTAAHAAADGLARREHRVRDGAAALARAMERDVVPVGTIVAALDGLAAGPIADAVRLLESARDADDRARIDDLTARSLPVQDRIIAELEALLARLQRNEQAKKELRRLAKKDEAAHKQITEALAAMVSDLGELLKDETELGAKFERLPKKGEDAIKDEDRKATQDLEEFRKKWNAWAKGKVNELTKLPAGFVDDFGVRADANKVFEEIEKAAQRPKPAAIEPALEDLGTGLEEQATKMKEDLDMWMPDAPDAAKWVMEEPINPKGMKIPEMPLPKALEDLVGELLQEADEFDEEADDLTSAWGANLDQAGWGVADGPISTFSAKGKTGNDLPNNMELSGRSGDGRRGKSSGQMVGDTARALAGRKTPARVGAERYEPGQLRQEGQDDPNGATGGGKKAGGGRRGLQGGTPPDFAKDMGRLAARQAGLREKAEQVARQLDALGLAAGRRIDPAVRAMKASEADLRDLRYADAARKRRVALGQLRSALGDAARTTAAALSHARDLPPSLRTELLQGADEGYPPGYEAMLKEYYKALSAIDR